MSLHVSANEEMGLIPTPRVSAKLFLILFT